MGGLMYKNNVFVTKQMGLHCTNRGAQKRQFKKIANSALLFNIVLINSTKLYGRFPRWFCCKNVFKNHLRKSFSF